MDFPFPANGFCAAPLANFNFCCHRTKTDVLMANFQTELSLSDLVPREIKCPNSQQPFLVFRFFPPLPLFLSKELTPLLSSFPSYNGSTHLISLLSPIQTLLSDQQILFFSSSRLMCLSLFSIPAELCNKSGWTRLRLLSYTVSLFFTSQVFDLPRRTDFFFNSGPSLELASNYGVVPFLSLHGGNSLMPIIPSGEPLSSRMATLSVR